MTEDFEHIDGDGDRISVVPYGHGDFALLATHHAGERQVEVIFPGARLHEWLGFWIKTEDADQGDRSAGTPSPADRLREAARAYLDAHDHLINTAKGA